MRALAVLLLATAGAQAQPADTLRLADVRAAAERHDPRSDQLAAITRASRLRLANLRAERLPAIAISGQATLQDDVSSVPITLPGTDLPRPPHEQYRVQLEADQLLYDGGRLARRMDVERARLAESMAGVEAALHASRNAATEAFFSALLLHSRVASLDLAVRDLEARFELVRARVDAGAALGADAALVEVELIRLRQQRHEAAADRDVTLEILSDHIGRRVTHETVLALPVDLLQEPSGTPMRPELARLAHSRERALAESRLARAGALPDVRLFGQAGVGRPDPFVPFEDEIDPFGMVGVRFRWNLLDWGRARRDAEIAHSQAAVAELDAVALADEFERAAARDLADALRIDADFLAEDDRAVSLREEVLRVSLRQLEEGVLLVPDYVDRLTDLLEARLSRDRHRIQGVHAYARVLSTLGLFPGEYLPHHARP